MKRIEMVKLKCSYCRRIFDRYPSDHKRKVKNNQKHNFCSKECERKYRIKVVLRPSIALSYILGAFDSDGYIFEKGCHYRIHLKVKDKEFAEEFKKNLEKIGLHPTFLKYNDKKFVQGYCYHVTGYSKDLVGFIRKFNRKKILRWGRKLKISYIRGFFDGDGYLSINKKNFSYCAVIKIYEFDKIDLLRKLYNSVGFRFSFRRTNDDGYSIQILGGRKETWKFINEIKSSIPRKCQKF